MKVITAAQIAALRKKTALHHQQDASRTARVARTFDRARLPKGTNVPAWIKDTANRLIAAQGRRGDEVKLGRFLIGPDQYTDDEMQDYLLTLAPHAVGELSACRINPPSPHIVPFLLGGLSLPEVERQAFRALEILDAYPAEQLPTLSEALAGVGFGARCFHTHQPEVEVGENLRIGANLNFLLNVPERFDLPTYLLTQGAAGAQMARRFEKMKPKVMARVKELLTPGAAKDSITQFMHDRLQPRALVDVDYSMGIRRVFEMPWSEMTLAATPDKVEKDIEVIVGRVILNDLFGSGARRIRNLPKMTGQTLVGIAMLTGISIAKWTEFAVKDLRMRGESFLADSAIDDAIEIIESTELAAWFKCEDELRNDSAIIRFFDKEATIHAERLRNRKWPLWTAGHNSYYMLSDDETGATYSHKPERRE
ncbi:hypothetical protein [Pseudomonas sp.]|uniref:hypothetical protein n=1 Tax=Pseudomonas sp. TaxID=306 RepID=UPI003FD6C6A6